MEAFAEHIIDIDDQITTAIADELNNLQPLSEECCIYRFPKTIYGVDEVIYKPQVVSIGPFHYGRQELKQMEEYKRRYLHDFLQLSNQKLKIFVSFVVKNEAKLRDSYAEYVPLKSKEFVKMILVDSAFVIMILLKFSCQELQSNNDRIFSRPWMEKGIRYDMILLENQIPFFILKDLYEQSNFNTHQGVSLIQITHAFFKVKWGSWVTDEALERQDLSNAQHFLDFLRICQQPMPKNSQKSRTPLAWYAPSATELKQAGVKFKLGSSKNKLEMEFKDGILKIPFLKITYKAEILLRNLQVFEQCHCDEKYINDYIGFITMLMKTTNDVEIVAKNGIIYNRLRSNDSLSKVFNNLAKGNAVSRSRFYFSDIVEDLNFYCGSCWHKWKANLKHDYFNTPWAGISILAAFTLLIFTSIQTVCSVLQL